MTTSRSLPRSFGRAIAVSCATLIALSACISLTGVKDLCVGNLEETAGTGGTAPGGGTATCA